MLNSIMVSLVEEGRKTREEIDGLRSFLNGEERKKARACSKLSLDQVRNAFLCRRVCQDVTAAKTERLTGWRTSLAWPGLA